MESSVKKSIGDFIVPIPLAMLKAVGMKIGQAVDVTSVDGKIIVKPIGHKTRRCLGKKRYHAPPRGRKIV